MPLLLLLPAAAILAWLMVYPAGNAVRLAFTSWDGFSSPQSVGFQNFSDLVHDKHFKEALLHNLAIVAAMPLWIGIPYGIAWGLHREIWGWKFFRFAFFLPVVLSPVVVGVYYGIVLKPDGPLNSALESVGLGFVAHEWLNDPSIALAVVIAIIIWATFGIGVLIFLSALSNLDSEQIDAARVDGASPAQIQRHVIFWQLLPVIEFWAILIVIASFTAFFPLIYTLTHGGPGYSTYTVDFDLYQEAFSSGRLGYAAAIGVTLVLIIGVVGGLVLGLLRARRRGA
ncbi:MAG: sugar ABC transporter permease [Solirubrobacterales bacterium]